MLPLLIQELATTSARPETCNICARERQHKIGLGIRATELGPDIAKEDVRSERQKIAAEVLSVYFELVATQAGVDAARETVRTLRGGTASYGTVVLPSRPL